VVADADRKTWQDRGVNPSQEPAQPQQPGPPPADPTADHVAYGGPGQPAADEPGDASSSPVNGSILPANFAANGTAGSPGAGFPQSGSPGAAGNGLPETDAAGSGFPPSGAPGSAGAGFPRTDAVAWSGSGAAAGGLSDSGDAAAAGYGDGWYGADGAGYGGYELAHPSGPEVAERRAGILGFRADKARPWRRTLIVTVSVALGIFVLGVPFGVLWHTLAPGTPAIALGGKILINDPSPEEFIAADGWFTLLGLGFGLVVALAAWFALRRDRGPFLLLGIVVGLLGAGYISAPKIGEMIGRGAYDAWMATAKQGGTSVAPPELHSIGPSLVPAFIAAVALTLLAGWSNDPDLDEPGAKPGYGPNAAAANPPESVDASHWTDAGRDSAEPNPGPGPRT
jgi:hypothetical protein